MPDQETRHKHPSYVTVSFSRTQGGITHLFGSAIENHQHMVVLRICEATLVIEPSGHQNIYPSKVLCEVFLSPSQFAELLTTMNVYSGVPGTLRSWEQKEVPQTPAPQGSEARTIREQFKATVLGQVSQLAEKLTKARDLVSRDKLPTKKELKELLHEFERFHQAAASDIPWLLSEFQKATGQVVQAAKAEVDALVVHEIVQAGMALARSRLSAPALEAALKTEASEVPVTDATWLDPETPRKE